MAACKKDKTDPQPAAVTTHNFHLELEHHGANGRPFKLDTVYTNAAGNRYVVNVLKYFISNVEFTRQDGTIWREPNPSSMEVVIAMELPSASTMEICEVPNSACSGMGA